jgi:hypothetical protein
MNHWWRRGMLCVLFGSLLLLNSGCVFWRLHVLRNQLSDFPAHFRIEAQSQPALIALDPVLLPDDLGWLTGLPASDVVGVGADQVTWFRYQKQYVDPADDEGGAFDIVVPVYADAEGRVRQLRAPERFAPIFSERNFDAVFGSLNQGEIERLSFSTEWQWPDDDMNYPERHEVHTFLGVPSLATQTATGWVDEYRFLIAGYRGRRWNPTPWDLFITCSYDPESGEVIESTAYVGRLAIQVDLRQAVNRGRIQRL